MKALSDILDVVCRHYLVTQSAVLSRSRQQPVATARQMFAYIAQADNYDHHEIGQFLHRDRSTVSNTVQVVRDRIAVIDVEAKYFSALYAKVQTLPDLPPAVTARVRPGRRVSAFWNPTPIATTGYVRTSGAALTPMKHISIQ